jgi:hypothetical protein
LFNIKKKSFSKLYSSFAYFIQFLKKRNYEVIFYYPAHFNRGEHSKNHLFSPMYEMCERNNIKFCVFEEPDFSINVKRADSAIPFDFIFYLILIFRKSIPLYFFSSFAQREWFLAKILKFLFLKRFSFKNCIVISNSMVDFFRGLNINANIYDYQHGLINSSHKGYINADELTQDHIKENNIKLLVYGNGFKNILINSTNDEHYNKNVITLGKELPENKHHIKEKNKMLFSLQFADVNIDLDKRKFNFIVLLINELKPIFEKHNLVLYLKHHPRYANHLDFSQLQELSFIKFHSGDLNSAFNNCFLHMTMHSTVTFEAAAQGIPTILIQNDILKPNFFESDYSYPANIADITKISGLIESYIKNDDLYNKDSNAVLEWHKDFYQPIDEDLFVKLIKG